MLDTDNTTQHEVNTIIVRLRIPSRGMLKSFDGQSSPGSSKLTSFPVTTTCFRSPFRYELFAIEHFLMFHLPARIALPNEKLYNCCNRAGPNPSGNGLGDWSVMDASWLLSQETWGLGDRNHRLDLSVLDLKYRCDSCFIVPSDICRRVWVTRYPWSTVQFFQSCSLSKKEHSRLWLP